MGEENDVKSLLAGQIEAYQNLVNASKRETEASKEAAIKYVELKTVEQRKLEELEKSNLEIRAKNCIQVELLKNSQIILEVLGKFLTEKPIETKLLLVQQSLDAMRVIIEFLGRELLKNTSNYEDKHILMKALAEIGSTKSIVDMGFHAGQDITAHDITGNRR